MRLDRFSNPAFSRGKPFWVEGLWLFCQGMLFSSWLPGSGWRRSLLRLFGADIGLGVVIKPGVKVKFPWKLSLGDHSWLGEGVWIDNLDQVTIGQHCCLSQGAYLCTGNHRWDRESFDLTTKPVQIADQCWVGAMCRLAPGCRLEEGCVLGLGVIASGDYQPWTIYALDQGVMTTRQRPKAGEVK